MRDTIENGEILLLEDVVEEHPQTSRLMGRSLREQEESGIDSSGCIISSRISGEPGFGGIEERCSEEGLSNEKIDFLQEDQEKIDWISKNDSLIPEVIIKEDSATIPLKPQGEIPVRQSIKEIGYPDSDRALEIVREVSREVIEGIAIKLVPDIRADLAKAFDQKMEEIALGLFPKIAEKLIQEEIEMLKREPD